MNEYCASKFAVQGFSQTLRVELDRDGIDLLVVSPGTTKTDFYDHVVHGRNDAPWSTGYRVSAENVARNGQGHAAWSARDLSQRRRADVSLVEPPRTVAGRPTDAPLRVGGKQEDWNAGISK